MTSLTLIRNPASRGRLNLNLLVPDRLRTLSRAEIESLPIETEPGTTVDLAGQFTLRDGDRDRLILQGDFGDCDFVAGGMLAGEMHVEGNTGDYFACGMRGGRVVVAGNAGLHACGSLRGGQVVIHGNVGKHAAAALPGATRGMAGGELRIAGSADQFLGSRMRRGRIIVLGDVAAGCASRMIAGTIILCGGVATPLAYGMARGTIFVLNPSSRFMTEGLAGFTALESCELSFLPLFLNDIATQLPSEMARQLKSNGWMRCMGDRCELGQGEIIVRQISSPSPMEFWR